MLKSTQYKGTNDLIYNFIEVGTSFFHIKKKKRCTFAVFLVLQQEGYDFENLACERQYSLRSIAHFGICSSSQPTSSAK